MMTVQQDVYTRVTHKIIADLEKGNLTWVKPWKSKDFGGCVTLNGIRLIYGAGFYFLFYPSSCWF